LYLAGGNHYFRDQGDFPILLFTNYSSDFVTFDLGMGVVAPAGARD
jgi:hypothetical protein